MRIEQINLHTFKKFEDLTISGLDTNHRFIFLLGPNGSGKSSLLEAFNSCRLTAGRQPGFDQCYHIKHDEDAVEIDKRLHNQNQSNWDEVTKLINVKFFNKPTPNWVSASNSWEHTAFHIRGSNRSTPQHQSDSIRNLEELKSVQTPANIILSTDQRLMNNYQHLVHYQQNTMFNPGGMGNEEIVANSMRLLRQLQESTSRVFPGLKLDGLGNPQGAGTFIFCKIDGKKWRYKNLSEGEKTAFDILLDLIVIREHIEETVYCIDEPELHMHSELQARLLDEISILAPPKWQIWLATHSIGMVRWATNQLESQPGTIAFLDFHNQDFDQPVTLTPQKPSRTFWNRQFKVAIGELADLIVPTELIVCEGQNRSDLLEGFDAEVYQSIFGEAYPYTGFLSTGGGNEVKRNGLILKEQLGKLTPGCTVRRLYDRDDKNEDEVKRIQDNSDSVLSVREIENYLFDFEIIDLLIHKMNAEDNLDNIHKQINDEIATLPSRSKTPDDIKSSAPKIYQILKKELNLTNSGSTYSDFAKKHLVPLIASDTDVYNNLKSDIWPNHQSSETVSDTVLEP